MVENNNKKLSTNGQEPYEPYVVLKRFSNLSFPKSQNGITLALFQVPKSEYFVMVDNGDNSFDSPFCGSVSRDAIKGKAIPIYWFWDKNNFKVRWDSIGR